MATPLDDTGQFEESNGSNEEPRENLPSKVEERKREQKIEALRQRREPINILVIGPTGSGKSTFINNLMGGNVARASCRVASEQYTVEVHEGEHEGIRIRVYDTVGFGDSRGQSNSAILNDINAQGKFDLVLLCIPITGRGDQNLQKILSDLKSKLHFESWEHLVVVFTFTNQLVEQQSLKKKSLAEKKAAVEEKIKEFKRYIDSCISGRVGRDTFDKIPFCTAGTGDDGQIEHLLEENWLDPLWASCINQCSERAHDFLMGYAEYILGKRLFRLYYARFRRNEENPRDQENPRGQENPGGQRNPGGQENLGGWGCFLM